MTQRDDFDRSISAWLTAGAPAREPEYLLDDVLARTAQTRRRPGWLIPERWTRVPTFSALTLVPSRVPLRIVIVASLLILALAIGAAVFVGNRRPTLLAPYGPAANGSIAYTKAGDIVARDARSGVERTIIGGPSDDLAGSFSHDGSKLVFFRRTGDASWDVWLAATDGTGARRVGGPVWEPGWVDWSPAGDAVVVGSLVVGKLVMTLVAMDGTDTISLIDVGMQAVMPAFRPGDGRQILFRGEAANGDAKLFLVDRDGGHLVQLGLDPGPQAQGVTASFFDGTFFNFPSWSPDGRRIAFESYAPMPATIAGAGIRIHLADIGPTGAVSGEMTFPDDPATRAEQSAMWLPGGDGIVYIRTEDPSDPLHFAMTRLSPGPTTTVDLGQSLKGLRRGKVSPDGTKLLSVDGGDSQVLVTDLVSGTSESAGFTSRIPPTWQRMAP